MKPHLNYKVVILGGGPAGCATALHLAQSGITNILVVESGDYSQTRVGESIPPDIRLLLERMGLWQAFLEEKHDPCLGSCSSWGNDRLGYNDFLFNPLGHGWHLDRKRFEVFLVHRATEQGIDVWTQASFLSSVPGSQGNQSGFDLEIQHQDGTTAAVHAQFVVDATGKRSLFAKQRKIKQRFLDRLICLCGFFDLPQPSRFTRLTMLEAVEDGWWYAARLPNNRLTVAFASDPEIVKQRKLTCNENWLTQLQQTHHLAKELKSFPLRGTELTCSPAPSFLLEQTAGNDWLAVGDAASAYDPISSQGIHKALSHGILAAEAIAALFAGNAQSLSQYHQAVVNGFESYLSNRNYFYRLEQRWGTSPFWTRRQERTSAI